MTTDKVTEILSYWYDNVLNTDRCKLSFEELLHDVTYHKNINVIRAFGYYIDVQQIEQMIARGNLR